MQRAWLRVHTPFSLLFPSFGGVAQRKRVLPSAPVGGRETRFLAGCARRTRSARVWEALHDQTRCCERRPALGFPMQRVAARAWSVQAVFPPSPSSFGGASLHKRPVEQPARAICGCMCCVPRLPGSWAGRDVGDELLSHVASEPFPIPTAGRRFCPARLPPQLAQKPAKKFR